MSGPAFLFEGIDMLWLFRKLLIPGAAFFIGMWIQYGLSGDACVAANGYWERGVCQGATR